jgi:hypothetical protein
LIFGLLCVVAAAPDAALDDWGFDDDPPAVDVGRMPVRWVDRPLVVLPRNYRVELLGGGTVVDPNDGVGRLGLGMRAGVIRNLEVEIELLRLDISASPGFSLRQPRLGLRYRLLDGPFEVALGLGTEVPIDGDFTVDGGVQTRAHLGPLRWDLSATAHSSRPTTGDGQPDALGESGLWVQAVRRFAVGALGRLRLSPLDTADTLSAQLGAAVAWTAGVSKASGFGSDGARPSWELVAVVWSPDVRLEGSEVAGPRFGDTWSGWVALRMFFIDRGRDGFRR